MTLRTTILALAVAALSAVGANAQSRGALRINEVMVQNEESVIDDYGNRSAWIELYNTSFAPMEIARVFLTNDSLRPTLYAVPIGDVTTNIPRRQHVIFWADSMPDRGTYHTSFTLTPGEDNYIALYDADGLTLIDEVVVPASLQPGQSYARKADGAGEWEIRDGNGYLYITPSSSNVIISTNSKVDFFKEQDENGLGLTLIAMGIVFCALLLLAVCFFIISKIGGYVIGRNKAKSQGVAPTAAARHDHDSGEEIAAIAMALRDHLERHDREDMILTLSKTRKAYSPWNSKIYSLRQMPEFKGHARR